MEDSKGFNLYICPRCGAFAIMPADEKCPHCQIQMVRCDETLNNAFIEETVRYVDQILARYYKKGMYDKELWKAQMKKCSSMESAHNDQVWYGSLQKPIKICPKCARIVTNNYLMDNECCIYCGVPYVELSVKGIDYYCPELKGERYLSRKIKAEMQDRGICGDISFPSSVKGAVGVNPLTAGVLPALIGTPGKVAEGKKRLSDFLCCYLPALKACCDEIDEHGGETALLSKLADILNHMRNVLRAQRFLGQGKAVSFWTLILIEIEEKYFGAVEKS